MAKQTINNAEGGLSVRNKLNNMFTELYSWIANYVPYAHPNHSGEVTSIGDGAQTIIANAVTNAKLAKMAASTIKGNNTVDTADAKDLSIAEITAMLGVGTLAYNYLYRGNASNKAVAGRSTEDDNGLFTVSKNTSNGSPAHQIKDNNNSINYYVTDQGDIFLTGSRKIYSSSDFFIQSGGSITLSPVTETATGKNIVFTDSTKGLYFGSGALSAGVTGILATNAVGVKFTPYNLYGMGGSMYYNAAGLFGINPSSSNQPYLFELGNTSAINGMSGSYFEINSTAGSPIITRQAPETADYRTIFSAGDTIRFQGNNYVIASVDSASQMTLTTNALTSAVRELVYFWGDSLGTTMAIKRNGFVKLMAANSTTKYASERLDIEGNFKLSGIIKLGKYTAAQALAIVATDGDVIYVTDTNATFTSVGVWARESLNWIKL